MSDYFNSNEGRALLKKISKERLSKLDDIYKAFDDKTAERFRGFIDGLDWVVDCQNEEINTAITGNVYDGSE